MEMRDLIAYKLNAIPPSEKREYLREVLEKGFLPVFENIRADYSALQHEVRTELPYATGQFPIWSGVMKRDQIEKSKDFFPIDENDILSQRTTPRQIQMDLAEKKKALCDTVFIPVDFKSIQEHADEFCSVEGILAAGDRSCPVKISLQPASRYLDKIEMLHSLFQSNSLPWTTLYMPYLTKLYDAYLVWAAAEFDQLPPDIPVKLHIEFEKFGVLIKSGFMPVWSLKKLELFGDDYPIRSIGKDIVEYQYDLEEQREKHQYLIDYKPANIVSFRKDDYSVIIQTPEKHDFIWTMYEICTVPDTSGESFDYEVVSNSQIESFAARMAESYGALIKTKAELVRKIRAFYAAAPIILDSLEILPGIVEGDTYDMNPFIHDTLRNGKHSKTLQLRFRPRDKKSIFLYEIMRFLVSHLQLQYPEFYCTGVLI